MDANRVLEVREESGNARQVRLDYGDAAGIQVTESLLKISESLEKAGQRLKGTLGYRWSP